MSQPIDRGALLQSRRPVRPCRGGLSGDSMRVTTALTTDSSEVAGGYSYTNASSSVSGLSGTSEPAGWFFAVGANISAMRSRSSATSAGYRGRIRLPTAA